MDVRLCESEHVPHHDWGAIIGVVFQYDAAPDQWKNRDELHFTSPASVKVGGMEFWIGCKQLAFIALSDDITIACATTLTLQAGSIILREGNTAFMSLAATLSAIEDSQEFELLRRQLMGAVEGGSLWLQ